MLTLLALSLAASSALASTYDPERNFPNARAGVVEHEVAMAVDNRGRMLPPATVNIFGLTRPVSVHWDVADDGEVTILIAEKVGSRDRAAQPRGAVDAMSSRAPARCALNHLAHAHPPSLPRRSASSSTATVGWGSPLAS